MRTGARFRPDRRRSLSPRGPGRSLGPWRSLVGDPVTWVSLRVLDERLSRGEIDADEYNRRREASARQDRSPSRGFRRLAMGDVNVPALGLRTMYRRRPRP